MGPSPEVQLEQFAAMLESGRLPADVVTVFVLDLLEGHDNWADLWAGAPPTLKERVRASLAAGGPGGLPPVFGLGPSGPAWRVDDSRRQEIAARLSSDA